MIVELENVYIGNGTVISGEAPVIGEVSPEQTISGGETSACLEAFDVTDDDGISRVWAMILPRATIRAHWTIRWQNSPPLI